MTLRGQQGVIQYAANREESGRLMLESLAPRWRAASRRVFQFTPTPSPGYGGLAGLDFFRQFLAAQPGDPTPATEVDALRVLEVLDAAYAAASSGAAVTVEQHEYS